ncbi:MAG: RagB/SusD family protein [Segetibacter sp.]|nr:RagB/SusD family protein [Segetibacter sp.]
MKKFTIKRWLVAAFAVIGLISCKKAFDLTPGTELDATLAYRNIYDADAAVMGIYGKFMGLADRYIILNELRGDLLQYTANADENLRQISNHTVSPDNPYANPRPFYELILNCNDVLKNFTIMRQNNTLKEAEFNQRYSDIACLRSFLYLQLGIHYGDQVRYITDPLEKVSSINDESRFPKVSFDALLDSLITFTDQIPFKDQYPVGTSLNINLDAYSTQKFFINKKSLLGDLHLWKGNYRKAATYYREVMETATNGPASELENSYTLYKLGWSTNANIYVTYSRPGDASSLVTTDGWRMLFETYDVRYNREWIWALQFDSKFSPENPLIKLFSPIGGSYLVKPSKTILDNWNSQQQRPAAVAGTANGLPYDARGLLSVRDIGGQPVVMKYLYNYINNVTNTPANIFNRNGRWFLYRQTHLHLRFAEAANREGYSRLAYGLFNSSIGAAFAAPAGVTDKTNFENTLAYPAPYNFDARNGEIPNYRAPWYRNIGIRQRANLQNYVLPPATDSITEVENGLINEGALENAFEGTRWADLLRVARRRRVSDPAFLADKIADKLRKDGVGDAAGVRTKLMDEKNWYLPFNLQ